MPDESLDDPLSAAELMARLPGIRIDRDNEAYYRGLLAHRLMLDRCRACGTWIHPPRPSCPRCWSWDVVAEQASGVGEVYMFSFLNAVPAADDGTAPFAVVVVALAEGVRITSTVVGCAKAALAVGLAVELAWIERDGMPFPAFRPATVPR